MDPIAIAKFKTTVPGNCSAPEGCTVMFDPTAQFQYFPSNSTNYFVVVDGSATCTYDDHSVYTANNLYLNTWSGYIEPWDYSKSVELRVHEGAFLQIELANVTTSQCTFRAAKIVNEEISHTSNKKTFLYIRGENFLFNGEPKRVANSTNMYAATIPPGNTVTKTITANSTPVTVVVIEVN